MAELNAILAKITEASQEKSEAIRARAKLEWDKLDAEALESREAWKLSEFAKLERESNAAYVQERAALEQEFKKKLLRDRRSLVNDAMDTLSLRLQNCNEEEFLGIFSRAIHEIELGSGIQVQFGANSPSGIWSGWIKEYMQSNYPDIAVDFLAQAIPSETGFLLRSNAISYRLMGTDIANQFLEEKGGEIEKSFFAGADMNSGERP